METIVWAQCCAQTTRYLSYQSDQTDARHQDGKCATHMDVL